jgi:hypothetical protein
LNVEGPVNTIQLINTRRCPVPNVRYVARHPDFLGQLGFETHPIEQAGQKIAIG